MASFVYNFFFFWIMSGQKLNQLLMFFYDIWEKNAAGIFKQSVNLKNKLIQVFLFTHMECNRFKTK